MSEVVLYHATTNELAVGKTVGRTGPRVICNAHERKCESLLSQNACEGANDRYLALFAFDSAETAAFYLDSKVRYRSSIKRIYQVSMPEYSGHPLAIVDRIGHVDDFAIKSLADEYWVPTLPWNVYEYMGYKMHVVQEIQYPVVGETLVFPARAAYHGDIDRIKTIVNSIRSQI